MKRLLCAMLAVLLLCGCAPKERVSRQTIFAMDTVMELQMWADNAKDANSALDAVSGILQELERDWSTMNADSIIGRLNRGESVELSPEQQEVLEAAQKLSLLTDGSFDPVLRSVILAWGFYEKDYRIPAGEELQQALEQEQWDLGGIIKGYAGQKAVERLKELNVDRAILNLGGNIQTYGEKPDGTPWKIGIQNPTGGDPLGVISVTGTTSVVTSGDYQRYFEMGGVRYHHIIDPKTGMPADTGLSSVTVICSDGMKADALSTALFVMGLEKGSAFWRDNNDFEAVFVLSSGEIYATQGVVLSGCEYEVIGR